MSESEGMRTVAEKPSRWKLWLIIIIVVGAIVTLPILFGAFRLSSVAKDVEAPLSAEQMKALIPRGEELAMAGDCFGCHSVPTGGMGAGGYAITIPFGTIYSTNITPDKTYGIGNYSRADFHRAVKDGIGLQGNLYPAMPYVFTHITTPDDLDALYAYFMSIPPLAVPNQKDTGVFALPIRPFLNFWTLLNFPNRPVPENSERTDAWNRGAYLVEGLAHCGACHTPTNLMMGTEFDKSLSGNAMGGISIPAITAEKLSTNGYTVQSLTEYLHTGVSPQGASFNEMNTVTHYSTSQMLEADVAAMANYLLTDKSGKLLSPEAPIKPIEATQKSSLEDRLSNGQLSYFAACSACHGINGEGIPNVVPSLKGDAIVAMDNPQTLISLVLNGLSTTTYTNGQRMYAMPAFANRMNDEDIADLLTWIRAEWGGQAKPISAEEVTKEK